MATKYAVFNQWAIDHGIICPKIQYPGYFGPNKDLVGIQAIAPIEYRESFIYVPYRLLLTLNAAKEVPELKPIIEKYDVFFRE